MSDIKKVAVLGGGLMGSGIAEICAKAGYETWVREINDELATRAESSIQRSLNKAVERGKLPEADRDAAAVC